MSDNEIFVYSPNTTTLTSKCPGVGQKKLYNKGSSVLSLDSGCSVTTTDYVFKRNSQIVEHEERSVLIDTPSNDAWEWISRTQEDAALKTFLESMVDDDSSSMKIIDIESK